MDKLELAIIIATLPLIVSVSLIGLYARMADKLEEKLGHKRQVAYVPVHADLRVRQPGA